MKFLTHRKDKRIPKNVMLIVLEENPWMIAWFTYYKGQWYGHWETMIDGNSEQDRVRVLDILIQRIKEIIQNIKEGTYENKNITL